MNALDRSAWTTIPSALLVAVTAGSAAGTDPYADEVVAYVVGQGVDPLYTNPSTTLGMPERITGESAGAASVVSVFSPAWTPEEIVSIGPGGSLVVRFDTPVTDDPANPFGVDLLVFGNAFFFDAAFPAGVVAALSDDGGTIEVSEDGLAWHLVPDRAADGLFPTAGYVDSGPYDSEPGSVETDFTRPVDPGLTAESFIGLTNAEVMTLYDGAGGGAVVDLTPLGLASVSYVRIANPPNALGAIEIDAFSDVAPRLVGDINRDGVVNVLDLLLLLTSWGGCPAPPLPCPADLDGNGTVDVLDLLALLGHWT